MHFMIQKKQFKSYQAYVKYKVFVLLVLSLLTFVMAIMGILIGSAGLSVKDILLAFFGRGSELTLTVIFSLRMTRVITAILGGFGLAVAGCVMQSILKNPLASASTLGISQGAAFGAAFAIVILNAGVQFQTNNAVSITNPYLVSLCAFGFSMFSTLVILGLSKLREITPESMILSGVSLSALFGGGTTILQYFADDVSLASIVFWTFGDMGRTSWDQIRLMAILVLLTSIYFFINRWNYNALESGESNAKGLGVEVSQVRLIGMTLCAFTASSIVSFIGIINFVGLVSPHLMRRLIGNDYRFLLPASALMGALMLLTSDIIARTVVSPVVLPIGAITSFLGAPLFLYLLLKGGRTN